jgi:hypothetical protein
MKWQIYHLPDNDPKALKHIVENLSMGGWHQNALSTRLTARFSSAPGSAIAITFEQLDLERVEAFRWAGAYAGSKWLHDALGPDKIPRSEFPITGMVQFVDEYLRGDEHSVVVCENWSGRRSEMAKWPYVNQSRMLYFGEQVYHLLKHGDTSLELIDDTISESKSHCGIGVCSSCEVVPDGEVHSEAFFDEIVGNTKHIFVPAFDGEGFLIWSPMS